MDNHTPPAAFALDVTHDAAAKLISARLRKGRILDCGCGNGALSWRLKQLLPECQVHACDIVRSDFSVQGVEWRSADINGILPYEDGFFDAVCAVEVVEHLENRFAFFRECRRVLASGGVLVITTPNILNLVSRMRSLFTGFPTLFEPMLEGRDDPVNDHINPIPLYYYRYALQKSGFTNVVTTTDRRKRGAIALMPLYPFILLARMRGITRSRDPRIRENAGKAALEASSLDVLLGRTLVMVAETL